MLRRLLVTALLPAALQLSCAATDGTGVDCWEYGVPQLSGFQVLEDTLDLAAGTDTLHVRYDATGALDVWMLSAVTPSADTVYLDGVPDDGYVLRSVDQAHSSGFRTPDAGGYQITMTAWRYLARHCSTATTDWDEDGFLEYTVAQLVSFGLSVTTFVVVNVP